LEYAAVGDAKRMVAVLLGSILSLLFFSALLAAEIRGGGDPRRSRELGVILGILSLVAIYASHGLIAGNWSQIAGLSSLILPGG
jgi:hypothetical protein